MEIANIALIVCLGILGYHIEFDSQKRFGVKLHHWAILMSLLYIIYGIILIKAINPYLLSMFPKGNKEFIIIFLCANIGLPFIGYKIFYNVYQTFSSPPSMSSNEIKVEKSNKDIKKTIVLLEKMLKKDDPLIRDRSGNSLLHLACSVGDSAMVEKLVSNGGDVNATNTKGWTPLHNASFIGNREIAEILITHGAELDIKSISDENIPLDIAITTNHLDMAEYLIDNGADINHIDSHGISPLIAILMLPLYDGISHDELKKINGLAKKVITKGGNINIRENVGDYTPTHFALLSNNWEMVNLLLDEGAYCDTVMYDKKSGVNGLTYLHLLAVCCVEDIIPITTKLINKGLDINCKTSNGATPLTFASEAGNYEMVKVLVELGADLDAQCNLGTTALHNAAGRGHLEIVKILIEHGADQFIKNSKGLTAFDYAKEDRHPEICTYLQYSKNAARD